MAPERFGEALRRSAQKKFTGAQRITDENPEDVEAYLATLHLEDLALACACSEGNEAAWNFFMQYYQAPLRDAARAILRESGTGDASRADELADSLYADLYGIKSADAKRKSLFDYFHGRSKLSTWLRAVLAQRHVDMIRSERRTVSLDEQDDSDDQVYRSGVVIAAPAEMGAEPGDPHRSEYLARFDRAFTAALEELEPRGRLLLSCYYVDELTLAETGRMLGEHESSVSRQLERTRRTLSEVVKQKLLCGAALDDQTPEAPLSEAQVELVFAYALDDWPFDLSQALAKRPASGEKEYRDRRVRETE